MSDVVIKIDNLWKQYRLGVIGHGTLIHDFQSWWYRTRGKVDPNSKIDNTIEKSKNDKRTDRFWALKHIDLEVYQGEVLGVIGRNGAGKSTLLKILSRVTAPTKGEVKIKGRIASLLEVGTGFHKELTGRENIYLNGSILGMNKKEIDRKVEEIIFFSEIETFIDTPVKRYSSGMFVRLAFSVAAHLEPEILLVDEVLAVGDISFQKKCLGKMGEVSRGGRTILFVSHNLAAIESLCTKAILLDEGCVMQNGNVDDAILIYSQANENRMKTDIAFRTDRKGNGKYRFVGLRCLDKEGNEINSLMTGKNAKIGLFFKNELKIKNYSGFEVSIAFKNLYGQSIILCRNDYTGDDFDTLPNEGEIICSIPDLPLVAGTYNINIYAAYKGEILDWVTTAAQIEVIEGDFYGTGKLPSKSYDTTVLVKHNWFLK